MLQGPFRAIAGHYLDDQAVAALASDATMMECLEQMQQRRLRSSIITFATATAGSLPDKKCLVFRIGRRPSRELLAQHYKVLDMKDVLRALIQLHDNELEAAASKLKRCFDKKGHDESDSPCAFDNDCVKEEPVAFVEVDNEEPGVMKQAVQNVLSLPCGSVANVSQNNSFTPCWEDDAFETVLRAFRASPRVPIFSWNEKSQIVSLKRIFSATDLYCLLQQPQFVTCMDSVVAYKFQCILDTPAIDVCKTKNSPVAVAVETDTVITTIRRVAKFGFTAMPIVSKSDHLKCLGVVSVRDFKALFQGIHSSDLILISSIMSYTAHVHQVEFLKSKYPSITIKQQEPLKNVVNKMLAADIQRIFLINDHYKLSGVFSRSDLGIVIASIIDSFY